MEIITREKYRELKKEVKRGEVYWIKEAEAAVGCEMFGTRPGIIVSNDIGNFHSPNVEVVYLTTANKKTLPTHVPLNDIGTALCESVYTVSKERLGERLKTLTESEMSVINDKLLISLGIDKPQEKPQASGDAEYWKDKFDRLFDKVTRRGI